MSSDILSSGAVPLLPCRKALFTSVHYLIHLNLAVALFLGYALFLAGTYYGPQHPVSLSLRNFSYQSHAIHFKIACTVVAGGLHYLFLSVFCWMLCEGIMLYLMLVVVFSTLSKKWWLFLLLGWGIVVAVRHLQDSTFPLNCRATIYSGWCGSRAKI